MSRIKDFSLFVFIQSVIGAQGFRAAHQTAGCECHETCGALTSRKTEFWRLALALLPQGTIQNLLIFIVNARKKLFWSRLYVAEAPLILERCPQIQRFVKRFPGSKFLHPHLKHFYFYSVSLKSTLELIYHVLIQVITALLLFTLSETVKKSVTQHPSWSLMFSNIPLLNFSFFSFFEEEEILFLTSVFVCRSFISDYRHFLWKCCVKTQIPSCTFALYPGSFWSFWLAEWGRKLIVCLFIETVAISPQNWELYSPLPLSLSQVDSWLLNVAEVVSQSVVCPLKIWRSHTSPSVGTMLFYLSSLIPALSQFDYCRWDKMALILYMSVQFVWQTAYGIYSIGLQYMKSSIWGTDWMCCCQCTDRIYLLLLWGSYTYMYMYKIELHIKLGLQ